MADECYDSKNKESPSPPRIGWAGGGERHTSLFSVQQERNLGAGRVPFRPTRDQSGAWKLRRGTESLRVPSPFKSFPNHAGPFGFVSELVYRSNTEETRSIGLPVYLFSTDSWFGMDGFISDRQTCLGVSNTDTHCTAVERDWLTFHRTRR